MRGHFGVVFHAQSNGEVTVQISLVVRNLAQLVLLCSGPASIFPKPAPTSSVHNEINGLTLHLPKLDAMLSLVVRNLAQLVLLYSGPASIFPKPAPTSSVHNEINGLTLHLPKLDAMLSLVVRNLAQLVL